MGIIALGLGTWLVGVSAQTPALAESRNRLLRLVREEQPSVADVVQAVESDVALVIAVLRIANRARSPKKGKDAMYGVPTESSERMGLPLAVAYNGRAPGA